MLGIDRVIALPCLSLVLSLGVWLIGGRFPEHKEAILYASQFIICLFLIYRLTYANLVADPGVRRILVGAVGFLTFGDAAYYVIHYFFDAPYGSVSLFLLSIIPYFLSYVLAAATFFTLLSRSAGPTLPRNRILWIMVLLFWFLTAFHLGVPTAHKLVTDGFDISALIHVIKLVGVLALGPIALFTIFSAQDIRWSFIALGFFGFSVLEWGINAEILAYGTLRFSLYDLAWFHAVLMIAVGTQLGSQLSSRIAQVDLRRLSDAIRFYPTILVSIPAIMLPMIVRTDIPGVVVTITAYYFLLFLSIVMTGVILTRIDQLSGILSELSQRSVDNNSLATLMDRLPLEFQGIVSSFLSVRLNERKEAEEKAFASADQFDRSMGQLTHDIRSPLAAIRTVLRSTKLSTPEETMLIGASFARIDDIITETLERPDRNSGDLSDFAPLFPLRDLVIEKSFLLRGRPIAFQISPGKSLHEVMALGNETEFKRIVSNLIDNAVEAINGSGSVTLRIGQTPTTAVIDVIDTGRGIPGAVLSQLGVKPVTFGKDKGHGLGLYHCFVTVRRWGGDVKIQTSPNGTRLTIELRAGTQPKWLTLSVPTVSQKEIVVIDDNREVLSAWELMIANRRQASYFCSFSEAVRHCERRDLSDILLLSDFDVIGDPIDGVDFFDTIGRPTNFIMVTGKHFLPALRKRCSERGIRILPKHMLSSIDLTFS